MNQKKYKVVKYPLETYELDKKRATEMQNKIKQITKKNVPIHMTDYFRLRGSRPMFFYDEELVKFFTGKKRRKFSLI